MAKPKKQPKGLGHYDRDGEYYTWKRVVGKRSFVVKRKDYTEFANEVDRRQAEIKKLGNSAAPKDKTVSQFFPAWIDAFLSPPKKAKGTYRSYKGVSKNHIVPRLGKYKLSRLTTVQIQEWINEMEDDEVGCRTIEISYIVLKKGLQAAIDQGIIARNPAAGCEVPKGLTPDMRILSPEEMRGLIAESYKRPPNRDRPTRQRLLYRFKLLSGLRISEVLGLLIIKCDLDNGIVHVHSQLEWDEKEKDEEHATWHLVEPKGRKKRSIVLEPEAVKVLRQMLAQVRRDKRLVEDYEDNGLMFPTVRGTPQYPRNVQRQLDACCSRAEIQIGKRTQIGIAHVHLHDLRRTCLTNLANRGMPMHQLQAYAGHASITTTAKYYLGVSLEAQRASLEGLKPLSETVSPFQTIITINVTKPPEKANAASSKARR